MESIFCEPMGRDHVPEKWMKVMMYSSDSCKNMLMRY